MISSKTVFSVLVSLTGAACALPAAAQTPGSYADTLSTVYEAPQFIRAFKETCDEHHARTRPVNDAAYAAWRKNNKALLDELERRFMSMIRAASTDEHDYARNIGKYEGAVLANRQDIKERFVGLGPQELEKRCQDFPEYLKGEEGDLRKRFEAELKTIRKRKP